VIGLRLREWRSDDVHYTAAVTPAQLQQHKEALFSNLDTRMLVVGNVYKDEAIALAKLTEKIIAASPLPGLGPVDLSLHLPGGASHCVRNHFHLTTCGFVQVLIMFGHPLFATQMSLTLL
jgi:hypothetical protein